MLSGFQKKAAFAEKRVHVCSACCCTQLQNAVSAFVQYTRWHVHGRDENAPSAETIEVIVEQMSLQSPARVKSEILCGRIHVYGYGVQRLQLHVPVRNYRTRANTAHSNGTLQSEPTVPVMYTTLYCTPLTLQFKLPCTGRTS